MAALHLAKPRDRMAMYRAATRYQVALCDPAGLPVAILAYDAKRTRRALLCAMQVRGAELCAHFPALADTGAEWDSKAQAWRLDHGHSVRFTGRTELEAFGEGVQ